MRPTLSAARPGQSILVPAPGSVDSGAAKAVIAIPSAATGRFIQKITRQSSSISTPPASGPIASATAETAAQMPSARGCSSAGKTLQTSASESEQHRRRPDALQDPAGDQPVLVAGGAGDDRAERRRRPCRAMKTRLRPNMSPSRPAVTTSTAIVSR